MDSNYPSMLSLSFWTKDIIYEIEQKTIRIHIILHNSQNSQGMHLESYLSNALGPRFCIPQARKKKTKRNGTNQHKSMGNDNCWISWAKLLDIGLNRAALKPWSMSAKTGAIILGKWKMLFTFHIQNMANFDYIHHIISSSINLIFMKSS